MPTKAPAKSKPKSTGKTSDVPIGALIPQPHGGALRNGGTNAGGTGRPRDEWKQRLQSIVSADKVLDELGKVLKDPDHPAYVGALKYATEHGYGKATETIELSGKNGGPIEQAWVFGTRTVGF